MKEKGYYTVVIADDEDELREALCRAIPYDELGFRLVGSADNGLDALELVETLEPDLLITDIRMPFISGIELARQVREIRPSMHIAFLSGYDDFEYAKQAIQYNIISYMLKPLTREALVKELTNIREKMDAWFKAFREQPNARAEKSHFLMPLLLDDYPEDIVGEELLHRQAEESGLLSGADDHPMYVIAAMSLTGTDGKNTTSPSTVGSLGSIAGKYFRYTGFYSGGKVIMLLMGNSSDFDEYLHILVNEWLQMCERVLNTKCRVDISRMTNQLSNLHRNYREVMSTMGFGSQTQSRIRFLTDTMPMSSSNADSLNEQINRMENSFKRGDMEQLRREIHQMIFPPQSEPRSKSWINMAVLQLVSGIYQILYAAGGGEAVNALESRNNFSRMSDHYSSGAQLQAAVEEFCICAMNALENLQQSDSDRLCRQALELIEKNYQDESLSLVSLSGQLNVSPNHLSACIKKYAGESFINVLIKKRMETARELLLNTPMKIMEISQRCGYSDQHYFSYCFKKYCGITPNMLRKEQTKGEKS